MAFLAARGSLKDKTAEASPTSPAVEFFPFKNEKDLKTALIALSNDVPNYYVLSFRPSTPTPGIHAFQVSAAPSRPLQHKSPPRILDRRRHTKARRLEIKLAKCTRADDSCELSS